jgi:hypothetical protein
LLFVVDVTFGEAAAYSNEGAEVAKPCGDQFSGILHFFGFGKNALFGLFREFAVRAIVVPEAACELRSPATAFGRVELSSFCRLPRADALGYYLPPLRRFELGEGEFPSLPTVSVGQPSVSGCAPTDSRGRLSLHNFYSGRPLKK